MSPSIYVTTFALLLALGCSDDSAPTDGGGDSSTGTDSGRDTGGRDTGDRERDSGDRDVGSTESGTVTFIPIYEEGSAWTSNDAARQMVDRVFADFSANVRTSGDWNATIEVYLTDDNTMNANMTHPGMLEVMVEGQSVRVLPAWAAIVRNMTNGTAQPDGTNTEFTIHYNVTEHPDNDGLLRHEMMHGMGAVNRLPNFSVSEAGERTGPTEGERIEAALYDLHLVDLDGNRLIGDYADGTFGVQPHRIEATLAEWMDGDGGVFFRGIADDGGDFDMACGTFPAGPSRGLILLNEPSDLMFASAHPTWNTLDEPDRAFLRAMGYVVP